MVIAGLLADNVFEPAMQINGSLAPIFGDLVGTGAGAGIGLMFVIIGIANVLIGVICYGVPIIRNVEILVADFDDSLIATAPD